MNETIKNYQEKKNSLERLAALEKDINTINSELAAVKATMQAVIESVEKHLNTLNKKSDSTMEAVFALIDLAGNDKFVATVENRRRAEMVVNLERQAAEIKKSVDEGVLVPTDKVTEEVVVGGIERDAEGKEIFPSKVYFEFKNMNDTVKPKALGQGVGAKVETLNNGTFEIAEIYAISKEPAKAPPPPASETVVEATATPA